MSVVENVLISLKEPKPVAMNVLKSLRVLHQIRIIGTPTSRQIFTSPVTQLFHEKSKKDKYEKDPTENVPKKKLILDGLKLLKDEIKLWREEMTEKLKMDPILITRPGEVDIAFKFTEDKDFNRWVISADSDHNEGFSSAKLEKSNAGYGLFNGFVTSTVPKDGRVKRAGYCNMKSTPEKKSFQRETYFDWSAYNTLVLKVRGDGRSYLVNLHSEGYFDVLWFDIYHYVLYTRGGPHWQTTRIPFSKFFLSSKGRIQDNQCPLNTQRISSVSFSVGAKGGTDGPFGLEIAYVGLEYDPNHMEEFAYEMYMMPKNLAAT